MYSGKLQNEYDAVMEQLFFKLIIYNMYQIYQHSRTSPYSGQYFLPNLVFLGEDCSHSSLGCCPTWSILLLTFVGPGGHIIDSESVGEDGGVK